MNLNEPTILVSRDRAAQTIKDLSRRGFMVSIVGGGAALALAACSSTDTSPAASATLDGSKIEDSLILGNYADYVNKTNLESFTKNAGPKVGLQLYSSGNELVSKLNGGGAKYDVIVPGPTEINQLAQLNLLRKLDKSLIPNLKNVLPSVLDSKYDPGNTYGVPKSVGIVSFYYLSDVKGAADARSMADMFEVIKMNKGRNICLFNTPKETFTIALAAVGAPINSEDPKDIEAATQALIDIKPFITLYSNDQLSAMQARQIDLGLGYNGTTYQANQTSPENPYDFMLPSDGTTEYFVDNWSIPAAGENPVAAHAFINFMCQPEIAASETNVNFYTSPVEGIKPHLDPALAAVDYLNPTDEQLGKYNVLIATPNYLNLVSDAFAKFKAA